MRRRSFLAASLSSFATLAAPGFAQARPRVVVVGGGYAGATAAKYLRLWSKYTVDVTLIEPNAAFVSCPMSNLVLGGSRTMDFITHSYDALVKKHGVSLVSEAATAIDSARRTVTVASGTRYSYDRCIVAPGIDFIWSELPGMQSEPAQQQVLHAWKAGAQTLALRRQLEAMPDGGVFAISVPQTPFRCPPAPYERASQVAFYFSRFKKKSKVLVLDANDEIASKPALFRRAWRELYPDIIEYRPKFLTVDVDAPKKTAISEFGDEVAADVLNVIPPQRAGTIAQTAGLANINKRWCEVDFLTWESTQAKNIHVLGDAIQVAPQMPKSGHMANQQAKLAAGAVLDLLDGRLPNPRPLAANTCYSFVTDRAAMHVASVHVWDAEHRTMMPVPGAGGLSAVHNEKEGGYGLDWARNIWADTLG